ncbi:hypothetical protein C8F04DRAFT_1230157, partial [Mycena alexandri]
MANPRTSLLLSHRGVEAWLTNHKAHTIPPGVVTVTGNQVKTTVHVPEKTAYLVRWRSIAEKPIDALCEIMLPKHEKAATSFMAQGEADTQYRTSKTTFSPDKDGWFYTPPATEKGGFVQLEIRRARSAPEQISPPQPKDSRGSKQQIKVDLIDGVDDPPFIIFKFEFEASSESVKRRHVPEENPGPQKRKKTECGGAKLSPRQRVKTPTKKAAKASVKSTGGSPSTSGGKTTIMDKLIAAKAE